MNRKSTYYYDKSLEEIENIKKSGKRPTLGIHVCCGPCFAFPIEFLTPYFKVYVLYYNPNIYPEEEYSRRLGELKKYVEYFNNLHGTDVEIKEFSYDHKEYMECLKEYAGEREGGKRCFLCYEKRMDLTYKFADDNHFDYFTTVMTISRQKNSFKLNEIGEKLSSKYHTKYFYSDFKKKGGIDRGKAIKDELGMYNQLYCGCEYSYAAYEKKLKL